MWGVGFASRRLPTARASHLLATQLAVCSLRIAPPFNSPTQAKQLACSSPHPKIRLTAVFCLWIWGELNSRLEDDLKLHYKFSRIL